jgi:tetratricopeptide (TPR) repeat protein
VAEVLELADRHAADGNYGAAEHLLLQLHRAAPESDHLRMVLASLYGAAGRWDWSLPLLDAVLAAHPADHAALTQRAHALYQQNRMAEAVTTMETAIRLSGETAELRNNLGLYRAAAGDFPGAEAAFRDAIRLEGNLVAAYHNLLDIPDAALPDGLLTQMERAAECADLGEADAALLDFCISRYYRRRLKPADEFRYLNRAKSVMARRAPWDAAGFTADVMAVMTMSQAQYSEFRSTVSGGPAPIVICSMPRAGSTLIEQIVSSHAAVTSIGEAGLATRATQAAVAQHRLAQPLYPAWCTLPAAAAVFATARQGFRDNLAGHNVTTARFCEKSVNNDILLGLWLLAYPEARVVHCRRDPLDICLSCYQGYFSRGMAFSNKLSWVAERYVLHERLMEHWKRLFPAQVLTVSYEDVVGDPRGEIGRLLGLLDLPWDDACLEFHRNDNPVRSASNWQVRQPLYQSSAHRWRQYRDQLAEIMHLGG